MQKIRDANRFRETKPCEMTYEAISVYRQANIFWPVVLRRRDTTSRASRNA